MNDNSPLRATTAGAFGILFSVLTAGCSDPQTTTVITPLELHVTALGQERNAAAAPRGPQVQEEPQRKAVTALATPSDVPDLVRTAALPAETSEKAPAPVPQTQRREDPPPAVKTIEPVLDIAALKTRLRDTKAIGVMTKLALKNQVDDLMEQFRAHYAGDRKTSIASLRPPYDMLVLKVLAVVQNGDPALAQTIAGSREAIWAILADREKFNSFV